MQKGDRGFFIRGQEEYGSTLQSEWIDITFVQMRPGTGGEFSHWVWNSLDILTVLEPSEKSRIGNKI
jgi:hypothetical protein